MSAPIASCRHSATTLTATRVWFQPWGPLLVPLPSLHPTLSCHVSTVLSKKKKDWHLVWSSAAVLHLLEVLCIYRCSSAYLSCNKCLFELLLPFYQFSFHVAILLWSLAFSHTQLPLTGYLNFLDHSLETLEIVCENPRSSAVFEKLRPARLAPTTVPP